MSNFYKKYLKYKSKYLILKNQNTNINNLIGGGNNLDVKSFIEKCEKKINFDPRRFSLYNVDDANLEEKYKDISILHTKLNKPGKHPLLIITGFSMKSSCDVLKIILENISDIENKFSDLFLVFWGKEIEARNLVIRNLPKITIREESVKIKKELAPVMDKILKSPLFRDYDNITLMGKSAGGAVSIFLTNINTQIKTLLLVCPAIDQEDTSLENRKGNLKIKMMMNKDDEKVDYRESEKFIENFNELNIQNNFYLYEEGKHELNPKFLKEI